MSDTELNEEPVKIELAPPTNSIKCGVCGKEYICSNVHMRMMHEGSKRHQAALAAQRAKKLETISEMESTPKEEVMMLYEIIQRQQRDVESWRAESQKWQGKYIELLEQRVFTQPRQRDLPMDIPQAVPTPRTAALGRRNHASTTLNTTTNPDYGGEWPYDRGTFTPTTGTDTRYNL